MYDLTMCTHLKQNNNFNTTYVILNTYMYSYIQIN